MSDYGGDMDGSSHNNNRRRDRYSSRGGGHGDWHRRGERRRSSRSPPTGFRGRGGGGGQSRFHRAPRDWDSIENAEYNRFAGGFIDPASSSLSSAPCTQPPEKSFKEYVMGEPEDVSGEEAVKGYADYQRTFRREQIETFFDRHKDEQWFRDRYDSQKVEAANKEMMRVFELRARALEEVCKDANIPAVESESQDDLMEFLDRVVGRMEELEHRESTNRGILGSGGGGGLHGSCSIKNGDDQNQEEEEEEEGEIDNAGGSGDDHHMVPDYQKFQSIFIRSVPMGTTREDLEKYCSKHKGFQRVALSDPTPDRRFTRRAWITFDESTNVKELVDEWSSDRSQGFEGVSMNYDISRRVKAVNGQLDSADAIEKHLGIASRLIKQMDSKWSLYVDKPNPFIKSGQENGKVRLDSLIVYLRVVYSIDFYNGVQYQSEHQMPVRCGIVHLRGGGGGGGGGSDDDPSDLDDKLMALWDQKERLTDEEVASIGLKKEEDEVERFMSANCEKIADDKWLCPLSGKKFKAPDFVRKHLINKHSEKLEDVRRECRLFNAYLYDAKRPQLPPFKRRLVPKIQKRPLSPGPTPIYTPPGKRNQRMDPPLPSQKLENLWDDREVIQYDANAYAESDAK
ncbi:hypothetical protein ACOME3_002026 [Neoechinorhynchus agilis]